MKKVNNEGFSLVELIVVVAIIAVLVGVLAPQYVKYLARAEKTRDCASIGTVLDACETIALDPDITWESGEENKIVVTIATTGTSYVGGASYNLNEFVSASDVYMESSDWGTIVINVIKADNGRVTFDVSDDSQITAFSKYSSELSKRLE